MAKKKAIKKQKLPKAVKKGKAKPKVKKMKTLVNDSPKDETPVTVPHVVINTTPIEENETTSTPVNVDVETQDLEVIDNSTVELDHDFLVNNELTGVYDGQNTITKEDGSKNKTVPGLVPYDAAGAKEGMLLQIIYTGKDVQGNYKFVVNELEEGDPGYFRK